MTIVRGYINRFEEAARLAFAEAQAADMKPEAAALFATTLEPGMTHGQAEKLGGAAVRSAYGRGCQWEVERWWEVPVPWPRYESKDDPCLVIEGRVYLVARVEIIPDWNERSWRGSVVAQAGKLERTVLPLPALMSMLDGEFECYPVVGKDGGWTSRQMTLGAEQSLRLHDGFVERLLRILKRKPVADWLDDFGSRGTTLAPLVVGGLLGLMYRDADNAQSTVRRPATRDQLVAVITSMGYSAARASKVLDRASLELKPEMTIEEAKPILLKQIAEER